MFDMERGQSPSLTVGPFFHYGLMKTKNQNILVNDRIQGQRILIRGTVYDGNGEPIPDAMLEIWQADAQGYFNHPDDPNHTKADPHFKGFGRADTVEEGTYYFRTIKPGRVPFDERQEQAPHINVRVFARGMLIHAYTRLYFSDEAGANEDDPVLNLAAKEHRHTLIAQKDENSEDIPTYVFDIYMQGDSETVFFEP